MDRKSKIFFWILVVALTIASALSYQRYIIVGDYHTEGDAPPEEEVDAQREVAIPLPHIE